jgi:hypothetical protein
MQTGADSSVFTDRFDNNARMRGELGQAFSYVGMCPVMVSMESVWRSRHGIRWRLLEWYSGPSSKLVLVTLW